MARITFAKPSAPSAKGTPLPTTRLLVCGATLWAAARRIRQSPAGIKFLLTDGKRKGLVAVAAIQGLIGQCHLFFSILECLPPLNALYRAASKSPSTLNTNALYSMVRVYHMRLPSKRVSFGQVNSQLPQQMAFPFLHLA